MTPVDTDVLPAVTAADLYTALLADTAPFILDVRNASDFARWRITGRGQVAARNVPYYDVLEDEDAAVALVPHDRDVLVVCAKEGSSQYVAGVLRDRGIAARYLAGGIHSWGDLYDTRDVVSGPWGRIVQIARPARGDLSFMVMSDGVAAIIDPLRHIDAYLHAATAADARVTHIFETHVHADHLSGGPQLQHRTDAPYLLHPYDAIHPIDLLPMTLPYTPLADGQRFHIGQLTIAVHWFPGHTLGQVNFQVDAPDGTRVLFTGDGLLLGSFGRPDLGGQSAGWTDLLYDSMVTRAPQFTASTLILPAHFSALDEADARGIFGAPAAALHATNPAFTPRSRAAFRQYVQANLPTFPPQYVDIKRANLGLIQPDAAQAAELELGQNRCALAG